MVLNIICRRSGCMEYLRSQGLKLSLIAAQLIVLTTGSYCGAPLLIFCVWSVNTGVGEAAQRARSQVRRDTRPLWLDAPHSVQRAADWVQYPAQACRHTLGTIKHHTSMLRQSFPLCCSSAWFRLHANDRKRRGGGGGGETDQIHRRLYCWVQHRQTVAEVTPEGEKLYSEAAWSPSRWAALPPSFTCPPTSPQASHHERVQPRFLRLSRLARVLLWFSLLHEI